MSAKDRVLARREAIVAICEPAATTVISRVVEEAVRAASIFGLTRERATAYTDGILLTLPPAYEAIAMPDGAEREAGIDALAASIRGVSSAHHIPRLVERGLTAIAIRIAREIVRRSADEHGFAPDELEREFLDFTDRLQERLNA